MISGVEKFYCKSRLHAYLWKQVANKLFPAFIPSFPPSPSVLEIGTGQGLGAIFLSENLKAKVIAIDIERDMVETAIANVKRRGLQDRIKVEWGDAVSLEFPDESFDAVLSIGVLHHVPAYEKAIFEAARVLKRGGMFMIVDFDLKASKVFSRIEILFGRPASIFSWGEMASVLEKAGFRILKTEFYGMGMFASVSVKL